MIYTKNAMSVFVQNEHKILLDKNHLLRFVYFYFNRGSAENHVEDVENQPIFGIKQACFGVEILF